jgi:hypothetical protein
MKPTVGKIVHYQNFSPNKCFAALIICVMPNSVDLQVFESGHGTWQVFEVKEGNQAGDWHWPEREEEEKQPTVPGGLMVFDGVTWMPSR